MSFTDIIFFYLGDVNICLNLSGRSCPTVVTVSIVISDVIQSSRMSIIYLCIYNV